ncbi:MAG: response regulator [Phycisphaerae bacterium]|nr:response regulator [Phycisphaerae bacterium]
MDEYLNSCHIINVLLIEDNPGDVRLIRETLNENKLCFNLHHAKDGLEAREFLKKENNFVDAPDPDLILLELNLPKKNGGEVLRDIKNDERLKHIPVIVLTSSQADCDILKCHNLHANCFVTKPVDLDQFATIIKNIQNFWFTIVKLPCTEGALK